MPTWRNRGAAFGLSLVAGYGAAVLVNVWLFRWCHDQPCEKIWQDALPALASLLSVGWFASRAAWSIPSALLVGIAATIGVLAAGAPWHSHYPLTVNMLRLPLSLAQGLWSIALAPHRFMFGLILAWPLLALGAVCTVLFAWTRRADARISPYHGLIVGITLLVALLSEIFVAPAAWSPVVNRRIAEFELRGYPGAQVHEYRAWSAAQLHYQVPESASAEQVLGFYDGIFSQWRVLDRTTEDGLWIDPSGTVVAWMYVTPSSKGDGSHFVGCSLRDVDHVRWQHALRRTTSGDALSRLLAR